MRLILIPQIGLPGEAETTLSVAGNVLTIDGVAHNVEELEEPLLPILSIGQDETGTRVVEVLVRLDPLTTADFLPSSPWEIDIAEGPVEIPAVRRLLEPTPNVFEERAETD